MATNFLKKVAIYCDGNGLFYLMNGVLIALSGGGVSVIDGNDITYILDGGLF